jgi:transposase
MVQQWRLMVSNRDTSREKRLCYFDLCGCRFRNHSTERIIKLGYQQANMIHW